MRREFVPHRPVSESFEQNDIEHSICDVLDDFGLNYNLIFIAQIIELSFNFFYINSN